MRGRTAVAAMLAAGFALMVSLAGMPAFAGNDGASAAAKLLRDRRAAIDTLTPKPPEQGDTTVEPSIAVNPANPKNAVTCYQVGRVDGGGDQTNACATTFNGGRSWKQVYLPGLTPTPGVRTTGPPMRWWRSGRTTSRTRTRSSSTTDPRAATRPEAASS